MKTNKKILANDKLNLTLKSNSKKKLCLFIKHCQSKSKYKRKLMHSLTNKERKRKVSN